MSSWSCSHFPYTLILFQSLKFHCRSCAIVSSSGQMLGGGRGHEIDRQDCVIRMNAAPTVGYEADVGSKTSLRVVSHTSVPLLVRQQGFFFEREADTRYVVWGPEINMRQDGKGKIFNTLVKLAKAYPRTQIYTVTREKIQYCDDVFQNETGKNRYKDTFSFLLLFYCSYNLKMSIKQIIHKGNHSLSQDEIRSIPQYWVFHDDFSSGGV